ncbi:MAG: mechanosensitive ion channel family protein [Methanothrix sp.]|nr:mechanosensitive ion channel family protein [Methanothrix sp.]
MDLSAITSAANPRSLADAIQSGVDSMAGRHVNLTSLQIVADALSSIDLPFIVISMVVIAVILAVTRAAVSIVDHMLQSYIPRVVDRVEMKMDETMQLMIRRLVSATIYLVGLMLVILQIPQLHSLATAMLAGAGIAGLAIGYAAKDSLSNFTSGIFIAIFQPFRVGDLVNFKGDFGQVEDLTLRHTVIRTWDNRRIIVPNSNISTEPIINWSIRDPEIVWTVDFDLERASDIDRAREIILEEARGHPQVLKDREIKVLLAASKGRDLTLRLYIHVPSRKVATGIGCEIRESVRKEFEAQGISPSGSV